MDREMVEYFSITLHAPYFTEDGGIIKVRAFPELIPDGWKALFRHPTTYQKVKAIYIRMVGKSGFGPIIRIIVIQIWFMQPLPTILLTILLSF